MQQQLIIINSKDRASGNSGNFTYNMGYYGPSSAVFYRINKITIPFSWNTTIAQTFGITYNLAIHSPSYYNISVPAGQYTPQTLVAALNTATAAAIGGGLALWSYTNNVFNVSVTNVGNVMSLQWATNNLPPGQSYQSVGVQMGFVQENLNNFVNPIPETHSGTSFSSTFYPDLSGGGNIYVKSQSLQIYISSFFNQNVDDVIQSVPVQVNPSNWIIWQNAVPTDFSLNPIRSLANFDFCLVDEWNNFLNLNGLDWTIELQIFYKP